MQCQGWPSDTDYRWRCRQAVRPLWTVRRSVQIPPSYFSAVGVVGWGRGKKPCAEPTDKFIVVAYRDTLSARSVVVVCIILFLRLNEPVHNIACTTSQPSPGSQLALQGTSFQHIAFQNRTSLREYKILGIFILQYFIINVVIIMLIRYLI